MFCLVCCGSGVSRSDTQTHALRSPQTLPLFITTSLDLLFRRCRPVVDDAYWCADGGGIRGYSALLILQDLMKAIGRIENNYPCGSSKADGPAESSYHPLTPLSPAPCMATEIKPKANDGGESAKKESSPWLPCHYFDYIAGTSTGGYV